VISYVIIKNIERYNIYFINREAHRYIDVYGEACSSTTVRVANEPVIGIKSTTDLAGALIGLHWMFKIGLRSVLGAIVNSYVAKGLKQSSREHVLYFFGSHLVQN
jgi:hypothetical protein